MQAVIDENGRIEIPAELREKLHLVAGDVVEIQPSSTGFEVVTTHESNSPEAGQLVWEDGVLMYQHNEILPGGAEDIVDLIDRLRHERIEQILGFSFDRETDR
jgi:AbrB family looped-hinge helix DNA binding protein